MGAHTFRLQNDGFEVTLTMSADDSAEAESHGDMAWVQLVEAVVAALRSPVTYHPQFLDPDTLTMAPAKKGRWG